MPNFRRAYIPGGTYFFTVVTAHRAPILCKPEARILLRRCLKDARERRPFHIQAIVLLPDHLHSIWTLPLDDADFSTRWADIKANFTRQWLRGGHNEQSTTSDQRHQGRRGAWQPRFMEHVIRDEQDFIAHVEYIHYNPVRHGLAERPRDWPWSSFHRYVRSGYYDINWGTNVRAITSSMKRVNKKIME